jgi:hypothetical protein
MRARIAVVYSIVVLFAIAMYIHFSIATSSEMNPLRDGRQLVTQGAAGKILTSNKPISISRYAVQPFLGLICHNGSAERHPLLEYGEFVYDAYEEILDDAKSDDAYRYQIYVLLMQSKGDRTRFRRVALGWILSGDVGWCRRGTSLLINIDAKNDINLLVMLISDPDASTMLDAVGGLAKLGGPPELLAFDVWLSSNIHCLGHAIHTQMTVYRNQLAQRIGRPEWAWPQPIRLPNKLP